MKLRSAALVLALAAAGPVLASGLVLLDHGLAFAQEPGATPPPEPSPTPAPSPTPTPPPPIPPAPAPSPSPAPAPSPGRHSSPAKPVVVPEPKAAEASIDQAYPIDYRSVSAKLAEDPDNPAILNEMGNILVQYGRLKSAIAHYERAVKIQPELAMVWHNLGVASTASGKYADGERAFRKAIKLSPTYALAYYDLGVNYDQRDKYDEAIAYYQRAIELDPTLLDVRVNPQVAANRHIATILTKSYLDRGDAVILPVQSMYPSKSRKKATTQP